MPDTVERRSYGGTATVRGAGSNSFDLGENVEENNDGLRTSAMVVKDKDAGDDKDEGDVADHTAEYLFTPGIRPRSSPAASRIWRGLCPLVRSVGVFPQSRKTMVAKSRPLQCGRKHKAFYKTQECGLGDGHGPVPHLISPSFRRPRIE
jgi:hypothetical protein